jgi:hypothetical protein
MEDREKTIGFFVEEINAHGGGAVKAVALHGSALGPEFRPGASDFNFVLLADPIDMGLLDRLAQRAGKWRKKRIAMPLLLTPRTVERSLDSYPLEFLNMKSRYRILSGSDFLKDLAFEKPDVRLQCERELQSKLLLIRRAYVGSEGAPRRLQNLVAHGLPSLVAIFRGMLYLKDGPWTVHGAELWAACDRHLGLPDALLRQLHEVRHSKAAPGREEIRARIGELLDLLQGLVQEVDRW